MLSAVINVGPLVSSSQTRGSLLEGNARSSSNLMLLDYVTISTLGNAADFGDSTTTGNHRGTAANAVRGVSNGWKWQILVLLMLYNLLR